jgi:GntR family L-lactate dehydrogenase operon transcriptional regulator
MRALQPSDIQDVVGVLVARRGLEREAARLAAIYVSAEQLEALEALIHQYETAEDLDVAAAADFSFHTRLTETAGNKVLQAATRLIHAEAQSTMIPETIRRQIKPAMALQHAAILAALRDHDPNRAEQALIGHLDYIIEAVQRYGQGARA